MRFAVGIEDTFVPQARPGRRPLDEYELTGHYEQWCTDVDLAARTGAHDIRWGIPWYRVQPERRRWDWSWVDAVVDALLEAGLHPIVDLMHYGCPLWLDDEFAHRDYPQLVAEYAYRAGERYGDRVTSWTPLNEPQINAMYCGERGLWPPELTGDTGYVTLVRQLARGIVHTQEALRAAVPGCEVVQVEATFRYVGPDQHAERIAFLRERTWLFCDLLYGRVDERHALWEYLGDHGFTDADGAFFRERPAVPDVLGINYYPQWTTTEFLAGDMQQPVNAGTGGIDDLTRAFHARYDAPIFWTETSWNGPVADRLQWLEESVGLVGDLRAEGVPVVGYTWFPLFSLVDWGYREEDGPVRDYLVHMGLYDLTVADGRLRRDETPLVEAFRALATKEAN